MNLGLIKEEISKYVGKKHRFLYRGSRNQIEEFSGTIEKLYPSIFIIRTDEEVIKAFTYSDYIIKNLTIIT